MNSAQNQAGPSGRIKPKNSSFAAVQRKKIPISENTDIPRLRELLKGTQDILLTCSATLRPSMEQRRSELEARITYLMSLGQMQKELHNTHLDPAMFSEQMDVEPDGSRPDTPVEDPLGSTVATKRRILETTSPNLQREHWAQQRVAAFDHKEAMRLEQEENERMIARRKLVEEDRARREEILQPLGKPGPQLTEQEKRERILTFMNFRPESDDEDDEELEDRDYEEMLREEFPDDEDMEDGDALEQNVFDEEELSRVIVVDRRQTKTWIKANGAG